ncbi:MAG: DUF2911 domain-containing protein, partial [Bacteroidota bacterium]
LLVLVLLASASCFSQIDFPPLSHASELSQQVGMVKMEVVYERPSARGRKIFSGLVPYGKVWRTGAGPVTKLRFSDKVRIAGKEIPAGTYSLLSIPMPQAWTLIINTDTTLYGASDYTEEKDVMRFEVPTEFSARYYETFTIDLDVKPYTAELYISWTDIQLHFPIETFTEALTEQAIDDELVSRESDDAETYTGAAEYYQWMGKDLSKALELVDISLAKEKSLFAYRVKGELLEKMEKQDEAIAITQEAVKFSKEISDEWAVDYFQEKLVPLEQGDEPEFISLFNGENLMGWIGNTQSYVVDQGTILVNPKGEGGGNLYTEKEYSDFILRFEFQLTPGANNGLGIHAPLEGDAAYVGKELQILDNRAEKYATLKPYQYHGSVYGIIPAKRGFQTPVGTWNEQEVFVKGSKVKVTLNGTVILDGDFLEASKEGTMDGRDHPGLKRTRGHIGFLGHGDVLRFRNIRIKEL